jgi:hypothetical protein
MTEFEVQVMKVLCRRTGSVLEVLPADSASSWGIRPALLIADELAQWPETPQAKRL